MQSRLILQLSINADTLTNVYYNLEPQLKSYLVGHVVGVIGRE